STNSKIPSAFCSGNQFDHDDLLVTPSLQQRKYAHWKSFYKSEWTGWASALAENKAGQRGKWHHEVTPHLLSRFTLSIHLKRAICSPSPTLHH
uniref:Uncharacterized protein n=1 Tax=Gasterosteus aculeatus TaxID=69293 RepID=G3NI29_GASAC